MTEANQVAKLVSLFWNIETGEPNYVVYVKLLAEFAFSNAARLASVVVSLACGVPLAIPVSTVVGNITATPSGIVGTTVPSVSALGRTEAEATRTLERSGNDNMLTAVLTIVFGRLLFGWARRDKPCLSGLPVTLSGAHDHELGAYLKRLTFKHLAAYLAGVRVVIRLLRSTQLIGALAATSGLPAPFETLGVGKIGLVTDGACSFNHVHDYSMTLG